MDHHHGGQEAKRSNKSQRVPARRDPEWRSYFVFDAGTLGAVFCFLFIFLSPIWAYWLVLLLHPAGHPLRFPSWWEFVATFLVGLLATVLLNRQF